MKRFYRKVDTISAAAGHSVALDGKPIKTPAKRPLVMPNAALAAAIAAEWEAQETEIRPAEMPLTRLASTAIDRVAPQRPEVVRQIADYAATDLVCYRAAHPPELAARQAGGLAAAHRLGGAALRRPARNHRRRDPGRPAGCEPARLCRRGRRAR